MAHECEKETLLRATTLSERANAVRAAIALGMPLAEIEEFLDFVDATAKPGVAPASISTCSSTSTSSAVDTWIANSVLHGLASGFVPPLLGKSVSQVEPRCQPRITPGSSTSSGAPKTRV